ncbi:MAG TPA: hypothetical protein VHY33_11820 [Thermoanaerobaculia bacterium]|nr:hypothetical protein [Thermoanaerobaculia bacterium]
MVFQEGGHLVTRLNCSKNSGATWSTPIAAASGDSAFPRVSVGTDGMVYTVSRAGNLVVIDKFSDCASGLAHQSSFPVRVAIRNVQCPVAGLDRCNDGNTLSSPTLAVDDHHADRVYLAFAGTNSQHTGQNIGVIQSTNGGKRFDLNAVVLNGGGPAKRFMPWIVVSNSVGYVGWYDRRNISPMHNDKASYYKNSFFMRNGQLTAGTEENLSGGVDDLQCNGWPRAPRAKQDATACTKKPQLAGFCLPSTTAIRCDYSVTPSTCPAKTTCQTGSGLPKYGDYNGLAVGGGKLVNVWASTVPPAGAGGARTFTAAPRVWATVTSVP